MGLLTIIKKVKAKETSLQDKSVVELQYLRALPQSETMHVFYNALREAFEAVPEWKEFERQKQEIEFTKLTDF